MTVLNWTLINTGMIPVEYIWRELRLFTEEMYTANLQDLQQRKCKRKCLLTVA